MGNLDKRELANLLVTVTNKKTGQSDSEIASPYYPAASKEQINTLFKRIRERNKWEKSECEVFTETVPI
jgi:hypothetical protein